MSSEVTGFELFFSTNWGSPKVALVIFSQKKRKV